MKKNITQRMLSSVRNNTPLAIRQKIGPILARLYYIDRLYLRPKTKRPNILSIEKTIDMVIENNLSLIRFGDGEIALIDGMDLPFQKRNEELVKQLEHIIQAGNDKLLICIPGMWGDLSIFADYAYHFIMHHMYRHKHVWDSIVRYDYTYGDTNMTRHYLAYKDKTRAEILFKKIFSLWEGKDIILIEGEKSRLGVGNNMFAKTNSLKRILCPAENAYRVHEKIEEVANTFDKKTLILLSLGPAAKVIAYNLFLKGYRVLDIGHIDMEYEMFLRKQMLQVKVPYKYFNEINERNPEACADQEYLDQILTTIL